MKTNYKVKIYRGNGGKLQKKPNGDIIYPDNLEKQGICAWMYRGDGTNSYQEGQVFDYPQDSDKLCPWLIQDIHQVYQIIRFGGKLGWDYKNTEFEKVFNKKGVTTEYLRCIDPTNSGIVIELSKNETT